MSLKGKLKRRSYSLKAEIKTQVRPLTEQLRTRESHYFRKIFIGNAVDSHTIIIGFSCITSPVASTATH